MGIDDCIHKTRTYDAEREMCLAGAHAVEIIGFMVSGQKANVQGITDAVVASHLQVCQMLAKVRGPLIANATDDQLTDQLKVVFYKMACQPIIEIMRRVCRDRAHR